MPHGGLGRWIRASTSVPPVLSSLPVAGLSAASGASGVEFFHLFLSKQAVPGSQSSCPTRQRVSPSLLEKPCGPGPSPLSRTHPHPPHPSSPWGSSADTPVTPSLSSCLSSFFCLFFPHSETFGDSLSPPDHSPLAGIRGLPGPVQVVLQPPSWISLPARCSEAQTCCQWYPRPPASLP